MNCEIGFFDPTMHLNLLPAKIEIRICLLNLRAILTVLPTSAGGGDLTLRLSEYPACKVYHEYWYAVC